VSGLKLMTAWVCPPPGETLPEAGEGLEGLMRAFYQVFPEYEGCLRAFQAPRAPRHVFVYVARDCSGLLPWAGEHLRGLLAGLFPQAEVRAYGKAWVEA